MNKTILERAFRSIASRLVQMREQMTFNRLGRKVPDLMWKVCQYCPEPRAEARGVKIGGRQFLIGGYRSIDQICSMMDVFDFETGTWIERIVMPPEVPQTHAAICCVEDRFIYSLGGQLGPRCCPAVADCFVFDSHTKSWDRLPPLPEPRYSPIAMFRNGRLHAIGGSKPDRWTPACDHWSLAVTGGKALERDWRRETPIPKGGPHRSSATIAGTFYVFGGQEGDLKPMPGDAGYACDWSTPLERLYAESFSWQAETNQWHPISPMPAARTHSEAEVVIEERYAVMAGGNEGRHHLSDLIQVYDAQSGHWIVAGRLPYYMKTSTAYHQGWLYVITGQRSVSRTNLRPDVVLNTVWRAKFDPAVIADNANCDSGNG